MSRSGTRASRWPAVAAVALLVSIAGCNEAARQAAPASLGASRESTPASLAATTESPPSDEAAITQRSREFWAAATVSGVESEHYTSLTDMAVAADAVVVGRIENVERGRVVRDLESEADGADPEISSVYFAHATVRIEQNLGGRYPVVGDRLRLQILLGSPRILPLLKQTIPRERAIFFLRDMGRKANRDREHFPEELRQSLQGTYDRVSSQGLLRDFGGKVEPPEVAADEFLLALEGSSFDDVVQQVRAAAQPRP